MSWKDFFKANWKNVVLMTFLLILVPNLIKFLGSSNESNVIQQFNFLSIELGGPSPWVLLLSSISIVIISVAFTFYFLKKKINYKDTLKIVLISAVLFLIVDFIRFLILTSMNPLIGGLIPYFSSMGLIDIINFIFSRIIYTPLFYILVPSAIVLGIVRFRKKSI